MAWSVERVELGRLSRRLLQLIVQVGNDKDLIKAMAVRMMRKGRIPNISVVKSIALLTDWHGWDTYKVSSMSD